MVEMSSGIYYVQLAYYKMQLNFDKLVWSHANLFIWINLAGVKCC
jgi:hypothetical protein